MKYRSFNQQLLIATALIINVFNDIMIDRRKHGFRDLSKIVSLKQIAQQKIQIPCILGERSNILRSLQNQSGKYKLPLIILSNKGIKTDVPRMVDLHSDIFYQQDESFSQLDPEDPLYKPLQIGKRRGQPITMDFQMTIISKYKEDLDQILSNWVVFFKPDIYVKWIYPRFQKKILNSQITWAHQIGYNLPIQYSPTNVFSYTATTSFSFKTWLFFGMNVTQGKIDPDEEAVIKKFKLFPNRGNWYDQEDLASGQKDTNDSDNSWSFGDIQVDQTKTSQDQYDADDLYSLSAIQTNDIGQGAFWGVQTWQQFEGTDQEEMKAGKYVVNNVFSQNHPQISGDPVLSKIKYNSLVGDFFSNKDKYLINTFGKYQAYLLLTDKVKSEPTCIFNPVYFKRGKTSQEQIVSSDFMFNIYNQPSSYVFGQNTVINSSIQVNYDITEKTFQFSTNFQNNDFIYKATSINSTGNEIQQQFIFQNKNYKDDQNIKLKFYRHLNSQLKIQSDESLNKTKNILLFNKLIPDHSVKFLVQQPQFINFATKVKNVFAIYQKMMNLKQIRKNVFQVYFQNNKTKQILKDFNFDNFDFLKFKFFYQTSLNGYTYQILLNKKMYLILKINIENQQADIYDYGVISPLSFSFNHAPLLEVKVKNGKMLLGFNINMLI